MNDNRDRVLKDTKVNTKYKQNRTVLKIWFDDATLIQLRKFYSGNLSVLMRELLKTYLEKKGGVK